MSRLRTKSLLFLVAAFALSATLEAQSGNKSGSSKRGNSKTTSKQTEKKAEGIAVGEKAPDFEVATFEDGTIKLSERFGDDGKPVVLIFSRANW